MCRNKLHPFLLSFFILSACDQEPKVPEFDKQLLIGQWELTEAWRNNKKTETLTGIFYEFDSSGIMHTNFSLDMQEAEFKYDFDGHHITQKGEPEISYQIDSLTDATLIFSTTFQNFPFKLELAKKKDSEEETGSEM